MTVLVVAETPARAAELFLALQGDGLRPSGAATGGRQALALCRELAPDLVLIDLDPAGGEGLETARLINRGAPRPVACIAAQSEPAFLARAREAGVQTCLMRPLAGGVLGQALELAHQSYSRERDLAQEVDSLREGLRDRKLVERARGILMQREGLGRDQAQTRLERLAASQGLTAGQAAQAVIDAGDGPRPAPRRRTRPPDPEANPA